jgi:hypothetical protein
MVTIASGEHTASIPYLIALWMMWDSHSYISALFGLFGPDYEETMLF